MAEMLEHPLAGPMAWTSETHFPNDGVVTLDADCLAEIDRAAEALVQNPLPIEALRPDDFEMPSCRRLMAEVRAEVDDGIGFAIIDRLPLERLERAIATKLYWLLMSMVGRPVAQKWDGLMVYDITDTGKKSTPGSGVRSSKTNGGQDYHNDNAFNLPPDFVALFCLQPAEKGGISGVVSFESVYNILLEKNREVLPRLYETFPFDRQMEHAPEDERISEKPIFMTDGKRLNVNFSPRLVGHAFEMTGREMDVETRAAIDVISRATEQGGLRKEFMFERGQIQVVNNRRLGHRRTAFRDGSDPERKRHLVRIWLRKAGRGFYQG